MVDWAKESERWRTTIAALRVLFIDEKGIAIVPLENFEKLDEYSTSLPTGTPIDKIWRAHRGAKWWLGRYVESGDPDYINITWYELYVIADHPVAPGIQRATDELFVQIKEHDDAQKALKAMEGASTADALANLSNLVAGLGR